MTTTPGEEPTMPGEDVLADSDIQSTGGETGGMTDPTGTGAGDDLGGGGDADGTDGTDGDSSDADGTDGSDGGDADGTDGTDGASGESGALG